MRLSKPWHRSKRVILGDSWFASVSTAKRLMEVGLYFTRVVKTGYKYFPRDWMLSPDRFVGAKRGATVTAEHTFKVWGVDKKVWAHTWNEPGRGKKPVKMLVSTWNVTTQVKKCEKKRFRVDPGTGEATNYIKYVPWTRLLWSYFSRASAIDVHNHL